MPNELQKYIAEELQKGHGNEEIKQALLNAGWPAEDVEAGFAAVNVGGDAPWGEAQAQASPATIKNKSLTAKGQKPKKSRFLKFFILALAVFVIAGVAVGAFLFLGEEDEIVEEEEYTLSHEAEEKILSALDGVKTAKDFFGLAIEITEEIETDFYRSDAFGYIAVHQASAGMFSEAMENVEKINRQEDRDTAIGSIATAKAGLGFFDRALLLTQEINSSRERMFILKNFVLFANHIDRDVSNILSEMADLTDGVDGVGLDWMLEHLVEAQISAGLFDEAMETILKINSNNVALRSVLSLALAQHEQGIDTTPTFSRAMEIAENEENEMSRDWIFGDIIIAKTETGLFDEAIDVWGVVVDKSARSWIPDRIILSQADAGLIDEAMNSLEELEKEEDDQLRFAVLVKKFAHDLESGEDYESTLEEIMQLIEAGSYHGKDFSDLIVIKMKLGMHDEALDLVESGFGGRGIVNRLIEEEMIVEAFDVVTVFDYAWSSQRFDDYFIVMSSAADLGRYDDIEVFIDKLIETSSEDTTETRAGKVFLAIIFQKNIGIDPTPTINNLLQLLADDESVDDLERHFIRLSIEAIKREFGLPGDELDRFLNFENNSIILAEWDYEVIWIPFAHFELDIDPAITAMWSIDVAEQMDVFDNIHHGDIGEIITVFSRAGLFDESVRLISLFRESNPDDYERLARNVPLVLSESALDIINDARETVSDVSAEDKMVFIEARLDEVDEGSVAILAILFPHSERKEILSLISEEYKERLENIFEI